MSTPEGKILDHELIYNLIGGSETFHKLVEVFYDKIDKDNLIRFMFPKDLEESKNKQFLFLVKKFGGPDNYTPLRGSPRLRKRHLKFPIGIKERNRWFELKLQSLREIGIDENHIAWETLRDYFDRISLKMINKSEFSL